MLHSLRAEMLDERTLNPNMDIVLSLFDFSRGVVFVGFGEGVYRSGDWLALCAKCLDAKTRRQGGVGDQVRGGRNGGWEPNRPITNVAHLEGLGDDDDDQTYRRS